MKNRFKRVVCASLIAVLGILVFPPGAPAEARTNNDLAAMKKVAEGIVLKLVSGDYEGVRDNFDDTMKSGLPASKIKEVWEGVKAQIGEYRSHGSPYHQKVPGGDGIRIRCQMERGGINVDVYFNPSEKVAGLYVIP